MKEITVWKNLLLAPDGLSDEEFWQWEQRKK